MRFLPTRYSKRQWSLVNHQAGSASHQPPVALYSPAAGMTLIEVLITLVLITVVLSATALIFTEITRLRGKQESYNQRVDAVDALLRKIAADVRISERLLASKGGFLSGPDTLILAQQDRAVVYNYMGDKVERIELRAGTRSVASDVEFPGGTRSVASEETQLAQANATGGAASATLQTVLNAPGVKVHFQIECKNAPGRADAEGAQDARSVVTTAEWDEPSRIGLTHPVVSLRTTLRNGE